MRQFSIWTAILLIVATLLTPTAGIAQAQDAASLLAGFSTALNEGDVEGAVAFFAEDGVVGSATQGGEEFVGHDQIRVWVERLINGHFHVELDSTYQGGGDQVTWSTQAWLDPWRDLGVNPGIIIVTVTATDGHIQTFNSRVDDATMHRLQLATSTQQTVDAFISSLNAGALDQAISLLDDDVVIFGALGDSVQGKAEAQAYYGRLINQNLQVELIIGWQIDGDRASGVYGLGLDPLRAMGVPSAETLGQFYVRDGHITLIQARFTPNTLAAIQPQASPATGE